MDNIFKIIPDTINRIIDGGLEIINNFESKLRGKVTDTTGSDLKTTYVDFNVRENVIYFSMLLIVFITINYTTQVILGNDQAVAKSPYFTPLVLLNVLVYGIMHWIAIIKTQSPIFTASTFTLLTANAINIAYYAIFTLNMPALFVTGFILYFLITIISEMLKNNFIQQLAIAISSAILGAGIFFEMWTYFTKGINSLEPLASTFRIDLDNNYISEVSANMQKLFMNSPMLMIGILLSLVIAYYMLQLLTIVFQKTNRLLGVRIIETFTNTFLTGILFFTTAFYPLAGLLVSVILYTLFIIQIRNKQLLSGYISLVTYLVVMNNNIFNLELNSVNNFILIFTLLSFTLIFAYKAKRLY